MSVPSNVNQALKALAESRDRGANAVRVSVDLLEMLLNGHVLLNAAMLETESKQEAKNAG